MMRATACGNWRAVRDDVRLTSCPSRATWRPIPSAEQALQIMTQDKTTDWWRGAVIYQIYPRSFQDSNGDGVGDLPGITRRLGHVADLGVDAIWISPFFVSPMKDFGYDVANYIDVDPVFGSLADFDALVAKAHRLGLKVIIDQVLSHTSDQHPWFKESRAARTNDKADWFVWADAQPDGSPPNNWLSIFGGSAWQWDTRRHQYYFHNFLVEQPDLNFHKVEVQDALLDTVEFWLKRGVDGFRLDTSNFYFHSQTLKSNPPAAPGTNDDVSGTNPYSMQEHLYDKSQPENLAFLRRLRALLDRYGATTTVGEVADGARGLKTMAAYTSGGDKLHMCYTFDFLGPTFSARFFREKIEAFEAVVKDGWACWAFSNHDVIRHVSRWGGTHDRDRLARLAIAILLSLRGSISLYEGEELGLSEAKLAFEDLVDPYGITFWPEFKGRDGCRTPMVWEATAPHGGFSTARPWLPVPDEHLPMAVGAENGDDSSVLAHYRRCLAFRRSHSALVTGTIRFLDAPDDVLAFVREGDGEAIVCLFNLGKAPARVTLPSPVHPIGDLGFGARPEPGGRAVTLAPAEAFFGRFGQATAG
jgi:alpha-glucosidase